MPQGGDLAAALWVQHTHAFEASPITPRLAIPSPEKRCGKTTLLRLLGALAAKPVLAANVSPAAMFRTTELARPTWLIDEADSFLKGNDDLCGIINSGHARDGSVIRTVGDEHEPRAFSTWAPAAIAAIGELPGTIADRSVIVSMRRRRPEEHVDRLRADRLEQFVPIARRCARWARDHLASLTSADPDVPESLNDRAADNWRPLLVIADIIGGEWASKARAAALSLSADKGDDDSIRVMLLSDIRAVFENQDTLPSNKLVFELVELEGRPWAEWSHGRPLTASKLAQLLKPFGISPANQRTETGQVLKCYRQADFEDAFSRYLPHSSRYTATNLANPCKVNRLDEKRAATRAATKDTRAATAATPLQTSAGSQTEISLEINAVAAVAVCSGSRSGSKAGNSLENQRCSDVAVQTPQTAEEEDMWEMEL